MDAGNHIDHGRFTSAHLYGFLIAAAVFCLGCSSSLKLSSTWRQENIVIDGSDTEWKRGLYYNKESGIVYSIRNDSSFVYILLKTQDRIIQRQIMKAGFTVWFDSADGNDHFFGIRYPLVNPSTRGEFQPESDTEQAPSALDQALLELEIVGTQKEDVQRFSTLNVPGIRVKIGHSQETLIYELQVPLRKTPQTPFAVGVTSANRIGIGFETEEFNRDNMKMGTRSNDGLSGSDPRNSYREGGQLEDRDYTDGVRPEGVRENRQKRGLLKKWLSVLLAPTPNAEKMENH